MLAVVLPLALLSFPTVGAVVASRVPRNAIGWLFLAFGVWISLGIVGDAWARGSLGGAVYGAWLAHWTIQSPALFTFFTFVFLLFPDGRLPSRRWRHVARVSAGATAVFTLLVAIRPGVLAESRPPRENPLAIDALDPLWRAVEAPLSLAIMLAVPVAAVAFVLHFRRSRGIERQQLKWLAAAGVLLGVIVGAAPAIFAIESLWWVWPPLFLIGTTGVAVAAGVAILRYRLYDIDRIVSRTVSYALLTALLGGAYAGMVFGLSAAFPGGSDLAIAASTLAVAALFGPVRRRVQALVDRRFNRARYDAARTIDAFAGRLRDEVDLDALGAELRGVDSTTMQPAHVALWLRPTEVGR